MKATVLSLPSCIFVMLNSQRLICDMFRLFPSSWAINPNFRLSADGLIFSMTRIRRFLRGFSLVDFSAVGFLGVLKTFKTQRQKVMFLCKSDFLWQSNAFLWFDFQTRSFTYSYFEKGCREKCTRQSWKALWVVLSSLFFKEIWKNWHERPWKCVCEC